jgi:glycosyltransferase involved in cell wall biosynthesis
VPNARLYFVGQGVHAQDEPLLRQEVARLSLESSVVFVGQLPQPEALQYVMEADVCTSPLYPTPVFRPASPTKLVEYLALGKAVVANDHPEQQRVIEESGAGLCVPYDEGRFADAIVTLLGDPEAARSMGDRGRRYALAKRTYGAIADVVERRMLEIAAHPC